MGTLRNPPGNMCWEGEVTLLKVRGLQVSVTPVCESVKWEEEEYRHIVSPHPFVIIQCEEEEFHLRLDGTTQHPFLFLH